MKTVTDGLFYLQRVRWQVRKEVSDVRFFGFNSIPKTSYNVQSCLAHLRRWITKGGQGRRCTAPALQIPSGSPLKKGKGRGPSPNKTQDSSRGQSRQEQAGGKCRALALRTSPSSRRE